MHRSTLPRVPRFRAVALAALLLLLGACSDGPVLPKARTDIATVSVTPGELSLLPDSSLLLEAKALDSTGFALPRLPSASWTSSNPQVVEVTSVGRIRARTMGTAQVTATIEGRQGHASIQVLAPPVGRIEIRLPSGSPASTDTLPLLTSDTLRLVARAYDEKGNLISGLAPIFRSSNPSVLSVDSAGLLWPRAPGEVRVSAASGGKSASLFLRVQWGAVERLELPATRLEMGFGETSQLLLSAFDRLGNRLPTEEARWTSNPEGIVTATSLGKVRAVGLGETELQAELQGKVARIRVQVNRTTALAISSVSPEVVSAGDTLSIQGIGFGTSSTGLSLALGSLPLRLLSVTDQTIRAELPANASGACEPLKVLRLSVGRTIEGVERTAGIDLGYQTAPGVKLSVGESRRLMGAAASCLEIPAAEGEYLLSLFHASSSASARVALQLSGVPGGAAAGSVTPSLSRISEVRSSLNLLGSLSKRQNAHGRLLDLNRRLLPEVQRHLRQGGARTNRAPLLSAVPTEGSSTQVNFPFGLLVPGKNVCTDFSRVNSRVVYAGTHALVLEDASGSWAGKLDAELRAMGKEFDTQMMGMLQSHFGNPLALDSRLDANGRLIMFFTPQITQYSPSMLGFVTTLDLLPTSNCAASNFGEIFYARTPTSGEALTKWQATMRSTIVHEVKHLISNAERTAAGAPGEESWLEEGSAKLAEEIWHRNLYGAGAKQNLGFSPWVSCDITPSAAGCAGRPEGMVSHFGFLMRYLAKMDAYSPMGKPMEDQYSVYGSAWALTRWALDQYGGSESAFTRALVRGPESGLANLRARTGKSAEALIGDFALALLLDDRPGTSVLRPDLSFPSWNLPAVYGGITGKAVLPAQLHNQAFGTFTLSVPALRGGSAALVQLSGPSSGSQLLKFSSGGAVPGPLVGLHIVRIR